MSEIQETTVSVPIRFLDSDSSGTHGKVTVSLGGDTSISFTSWEVATRILDLIQTRGNALDCLEIRVIEKAIP